MKKRGKHNTREPRRSCVVFIVNRYIAIPNCTTPYNAPRTRYKGRGGAFIVGVMGLGCTRFISQEQVFQ